MVGDPKENLRVLLSVSHFLSWLHNDRMSTSLGTPMVISYLLLPVGFCLLVLQYVVILAARRPQSPILLGEGPPPQKQPEFEQQL